MTSLQALSLRFRESGTSLLHLAGNLHTFQAILLAEH